MARYAAWKRELPEKFLHACSILGNFRIDLAVGSFKIGARHHARPAMAGTADIDHIAIAIANDTVEVGVDEIEAGCRSPMPKQARLDVLRP
ncbi:hypothetical protein D3C87_1887640 [compost metagenome]